MHMKPSHFIQVTSIFLLTLCPFLFGNQGCGNGQDFPAEQAKALQASLEQSMADLGFPGSALGVREVGGATWQGSVGRGTIGTNVADGTDLDKKSIFPSFWVSPAWAESLNEPMNTSYHSRIGSITKTYTATLILKLVEEGKLSLDDTIDDWMGVGYYTNSDTVTIRQLLNMTAGLTSYTATGTFFARYTADPTQTFLPEELVSYARNNAPPIQFAPGGGWNYSNTNFVILGLIAQKAGNASFQDLITNKIINPLNLNDTSVPTGDDTSVPEKYIHGYKKDDGEWLDSTAFSPTIGFSAGNMISTLSNMLDWLQAIHESHLLSESSTNQMMDFVSMTTGGPLNGGDGGYGLGLSYIKGAVGHEGEINGYKVCIYKYKNHYFAVIVNTDDADSGKVMDVFWNAVRALYPNDNV